jgi:hypothetical protein
MDASAADQVRLLRQAGVSHPQYTVCRPVVAVDVSPLMLARPREKLDRGAVDNVEVADAAFLTYVHSGAPADLVFLRLAARNFSKRYCSPAIHAHINLNGRYHIDPARQPRRLVPRRDGLATHKYR